jgi:hypothetical protein
MKEAMKKYEEIKSGDRFLMRQNVKVFSFVLNCKIALPDTISVEIISDEDHGYLKAKRLKETGVAGKYSVDARFGIIGIHYDNLEEFIEIPDSNIERSNDSDIIYDFASLMVNKMTKKTEAGRSGWDDPSRCAKAYLAELFATEIHKCAIGAGDLVDVANYCMMLRHREVDMETIMKKLVGMINIRESKLLEAARNVVEVWNTKNVDNLKEAIKSYQDS